MAFKSSNTKFLILYAPLAPWLLLVFTFLALDTSAAPMNGVALAGAIAAWTLLLDGPHLFASGIRLRRWTDKSRRDRTLVLACLLTFAALAFYSSMLFRHDLTQEDRLMSFLRLFFLFSYLHVSKQHFGFFKLLHRFEGQDREYPSALVRFLFLNSLFLPLILRVLGPPREGGLPLSELGIIPSSLASLTFPLLAGAYVLTGLVLLNLWRSEKLSRSHVLYGMSLMPIHMLALFASWPAIICVILLTLSHDLQYLNFVFDWRRHDSGKIHIDRRRTIAFFILAALFSSFLIRGWPFEWWTGKLNETIGPEYAYISEFVALSGFLISIFHYALDWQMWKVSEDPKLKSYLDSFSTTAL